LVYGKELLSYDFGPNHYMNAKRLISFFEAVQSSSLLTDRRISVLNPRKATREELALYHDETYIGFVKKASERGTGLLDYGDTPVFPGIFEAASYVVGSSLAALDAVMKGEVTYSMNPMGGMHHARKNRAAGFCVFNDVGVIIEKSRREYGLARILYVDLDAHHGDGVMYDYYDDPNLYIADFHEDGRYLYPGTGFTDETGGSNAAGTKLNLPLRPGARDAEFLDKFQTMKEFVSALSVDLTIVQAGVDSIAGDLSHLDLTMNSHLAVISFLKKRAASSSKGPLIVLGGGGYNPRNTSAVWLSIVKNLIG